MKKIDKMILVAAVMLSFAACSGDGGANAGTTTESGNVAASTAELPQNTDKGESTGGQEVSEAVTSAPAEAESSYKVIAEIDGTKIEKLPVQLSLFEDDGWRIEPLADALDGYRAYKGDNSVDLHCTEGSTTVRLISIQLGAFYQGQGYDFSCLPFSGVTLFDSVSVGENDGADDFDGKVYEAGCKLSSCTDMMGGFRAIVYDESRNLDMEIFKENSDSCYIGISAISEKLTEPDDPLTPDDPKPAVSESRIYELELGSTTFYIYVDIYNDRSVQITYRDNTYAYYKSIDDMGTPTEVISFSDDGSGGTGVGEPEMMIFTMTDDTLIVERGWENIAPETQAVYKRFHLSVGGTVTENLTDPGSGDEYRGGIYEFEIEGDTVRRLSVSIDDSGAVEIQFDDGEKYATYDSLAEMGTFVPIVYGMSGEIAGEAAFIITEDIVTVTYSDGDGAVVYRRVK